MTNRITIDEMLAALQAQKESGLPGDTLIGIPDRNNNSRGSFIKLDVAPRIVPLAKDEYVKGWTLCRVVSRGGVPVVVIG